MNSKYLNTILFFSLLIAFGCKKDEGSSVKPFIVLKNGDYTKNEQLVPVGGKLLFGITATNGDATLTNLRIKRIADGKSTVELDKGIYIKKGGLSYDYAATKSGANQEIWEFFVMNSNRDSVKTTLTVNLGEGSAYGEINYYPSIKIGMQSNTSLPNYVDLHSGNIFTKANITGHESEIDLVGFVYTTSGIISPTLCCPGYTGSSSVTGHYPEIELWSVKNLTSYDYSSTDNDLVSPEKFNIAVNDSLLVCSFKPGNVSGLCKKCFTNKVIPFKTEDGKYGLVHVLHTDLSDTGYMEIEVKIQK